MIKPYFILKKKIHHNLRNKILFRSSEYDWMLESEEEFDCLSHVKNPLNGFHLVKRTAMKWPKFVESLQKSSKLKKIKSGKIHKIFF